MKSLKSLQKILAGVRYKDHNFAIEADGKRHYLVVEAFLWCRTERKFTVHRGRKWMLSPHMTRSEVVQTAFKAVMTFEEHECRENFTFAGEPVYGPHINVDDLVHLCKTGALDVRK